MGVLHSMTGYRFHCILWLTPSFLTDLSLLPYPCSITGPVQSRVHNHPWHQSQNFSGHTPTFPQPLTWFRLCPSSMGNVRGSILSSAYTFDAWRAQSFKDTVDFRPNQKEISWLRKLGYNRWQPLMKISIVWMATTLGGLELLNPLLVQQSS